MGGDVQISKDASLLKTAASLVFGSSGTSARESRTLRKGVEDAREERDMDSLKTRSSVAAFRLQFLGEEWMTGLKIY